MNWLDLAFLLLYCVLQFNCLRFSFLGLFCVIVRLHVYVCFCCVRFIFFQYYARRLARKNVSEMTYFVLSGT